MPYKIQKIKKYFVVVSDKGKRMGKHKTRKEALQQMKALYMHVPDARKDASDFKFITLEELEQTTLPVDIPVFEIQRSDREPLYGIGFDDEEAAEENYLNYWRLENYAGIIPILPEGVAEIESPYNFDGANWHYNLDKKARLKKFNESNVKRDKNGRFARKAGSGSTSTKKEPPTKITNQTNIADLRNIAKKLGIKDKPEKYANRRESWRSLIKEKGGEEGAKYFKTRSTKNTKKETDKALSESKKTRDKIRRKGSASRGKKNTKVTSSQKTTTKKSSSTAKPTESTWERQKKESSGLTPLGSPKSIPGGTYENNGKKIKISEQSDSSYQDITIEGVPKIYTEDIYRNTVKEIVDHYSSPMQGSVGDLGEANYAMRSRPPIKSENDFRKEFDEAFDNYLKQGDDMPPIYKIRRSLGDRISREKFDEYFMNLIGDDKYQPEGGSLSEINPGKIRDSFKTEISGDKTYVSRL